MISIRRAKDTDIDYILGELRAFSDFCGTRHAILGDDHNHNVEFIRTMIDGHALFVADKKLAGPIGFIGGLIGPHPTNQKLKVLSEAFWWVEPGYRNSRAGLLLFNAYLRFGKKNGADWITATIERNSPINEDVYLKRGFKHLETTYILEVT